MQYVNLKFQYDNQGYLEEMAMQDAEDILRKVKEGFFTKEAAIDAKVDERMDESYDDILFHAPYDPEQLKAAYLFAVNAKLNER